MGGLQNTISVQDFNALTQNSNKIFVVDVRTTAEVNNEYFDGCHNFPLQDISADKIRRTVIEEGYDGLPIYLLCGTGLRAQKAAEKIMSTVSTPLIVIEGGINAMKQTGINIKSGTGSVISLERQVRITAGLLVLLGVVIGFFFNPAFYGVSAFVGAGLVFAGVTNTCAMGMALSRMPWNSAG